MFCPMNIWFVDYFAPDISICIFPWWFAFCPCLSHFPNSFRLFFCLCWCLSHFSIQNHLWISFSSPFLLPEVINKDKSEWDGGKGQPPNSPWRPPSPASPVFLKAVYFHPAHFSIHMTGWAAKIICLHLCHVSGPFINCQTSEFMDGTSVPVSFYAEVTHKGKVFAFASRATWEIVVNLICAIWIHDSPSPYSVGNYFPSMTLHFLEGLLYSSFYWCAGQAISLLRESPGNQSHSILPKLFRNWSAMFSFATEPLDSLCAIWVLLTMAWLFQLAKPNPM